MTQDQPYSKELSMPDRSDLNEKKRLNGFIHQSPQDKLLVDINRSGLEKLQLFTQMIRRSKMLDKAISHHK
jgi:hypothetical protein